MEKFPNKNENNKKEFLNGRNWLSFLRNLGIASVVYGTFLASKNNRDQQPLSSKEVKPQEHELVKNITFNQDLSETDIQRRKRNISKYLLDSTDIKEHPTEDSILNKEIGSHIKHAERFIKDCKSTLDSLLLIKNPSKSDKEHIRILKNIIQHEEEFIRDLPSQKQEIKSRSQEYLLRRDSLKISEMINSYKQFDNQKSALKKQIESNDYLNRLTIEFNGDKSEAEKEQQRRINSLRTDYLLEDLEEIQKKVKNAIGFYDYSRSHLPIVNKKGIENDTRVGTHEFAHQITGGKFFMSEYAIDLYKKAFDSTKTSKEKILRDNINEEEYLGNPTELDARKKVLEMDMEKLGIKNYGEEFTDEHYKKLIKLKKEGKLSNDAYDFLRVIKPEYIKKIMNSIAHEDNLIKNSENV